LGSDHGPFFANRRSTRQTAEANTRVAHICDLDAHAVAWTVAYAPPIGAECRGLHGAPAVRYNPPTARA